MIKPIVRLLLGIAALWGAYHLHRAAIHNSLVAAGVIRPEPVPVEDIFKDPRIMTPEQEAALQEVDAYETGAMVLGGIGALLTLAGALPVLLWVVMPVLPRREPVGVPAEQPVAEPPAEPPAEAKVPEQTDREAEEVPPCPEAKA